MTNYLMHFFPFPHFIQNEQHAGSVQDWPDICHKCREKSCTLGYENEICECSYGCNYIRIDKNIVVAGVFVRDIPNLSSAWKKRSRTYKHLFITKSMLLNMVEAYNKYKQETFSILEQERCELKKEYLRTELFKPEFLSELRPEIQKGLSFVHDYKQINSQISQNINVIIESRYLGDNFDDKLSKASMEEKAIYEASKFLEEKLSVAKFLMHPEWLDKRSDLKKFRFHGLVLKYRRIYTSRFEVKDLTISMPGKSHAEILANPQAVAVIPHTLIDNAAKYSPQKGRVEISTYDVDGAIEFSVSSYGPRILPDENEKIFNPFFRGKLAAQAEEEGAGFGLYVSQLIAVRHLGTKISFQQESTQKPKMGHWTTFIIKIPILCE